MAKKPTTLEDALVWNPQKGRYETPIERQTLLDDDEGPSQFVEYLIEPTKKPAIKELIAM